MILNLEQFNTHIACHHFKKKSINNVFDTITTYVYMAWVDLKDAFYYIPTLKILTFFIAPKIY